MRRTTVLLVATLLFPNGLLAQEEAPLRWTPLKSMEFRVVSQTAMSPDGKDRYFVGMERVIHGETLIFDTNAKVTYKARFIHAQRTKK